MIVRCPSCKTAYKVADDVTQDTMPVFRCSRCKHTFELDPAETAPEPVAKWRAPEPPPSETKEEREPSFTFPAKEQEGAEDREESIDSAMRDFKLRATPDEDAKTWSRGAEILRPMNHRSLLIHTIASKTLSTLIPRKIFSVRPRHPNRSRCLGKRQVTFCLWIPIAINRLLLCLTLHFSRSSSSRSLS
jgi:predicted Zn finger-like uncharacterized protein